MSKRIATIGTMFFILVLFSIQVLTVNAQTIDWSRGWCSGHGHFTGSSCPRCSSGGGTPSNITRNTRNSNNTTSQADIAKQQRLAEAYEANVNGVNFYNNKDWANALIAFQEAVDKNPNNLTMKDNLYNAKQQLLAQQQQQLQIQQNKAAVLKMQQSVQTFTQTLNTVPSTGGLNFNGQTATTTSGNNNNGNGLSFMPATSNPVTTSSTTNGLQFEEIKKPIEAEKTISVKNTSAEAISNLKNTHEGINTRKDEVMKDKSGKVFDIKDDNRGAIADVKVKVGITPTQEKAARDYLAKNDKEYQARQVKIKEVKEQVAKFTQKDNELSKTIDDYKKNYTGKTAPKEEFTKYTKAIEEQQTVKGELWNAQSSEKTLAQKDKEAVTNYVTFGEKKIPGQ